MEEPTAVGHAFNIANPRPITQAEVVQAFADAAGKKPNMVRVPRERIVRTGRPSHGPAPVFRRTTSTCRPSPWWSPRRSACSQFKPTDFLTGLKETYRWYLRHHERKEIDYAFEDRLMAPPAQPALHAGAGAAAH